MADELVSGLLKDSDLRVVLVTTSELARHARDVHRSEPGSAALFAQGLTAAALLGSLQKKEDSRINLQLECDGPLRGLFVDGDSSGVVRGYVKNPYVSHLGSEGVYRWRPALGNKGFLSVLRDLGEGEYYRSSVELEHFDLARDLERYFTVSDQVSSRVFLTVLPAGEGASEPLGTVAGLLVQTLPDGNREEFQALGERLSRDFERTVAEHASQGTPALLRALVPQPDLEVMSRYPLRYTCTCSKDRVKRALLAMGREELEDLLAKEGKAEATCHFCTTHYEVSGEEIRELLGSVL
jgi:molecular chaperone Hsp33